MAGDSQSDKESNQVPEIYPGVGGDSLTPSSQNIGEALPHTHSIPPEVLEGLPENQRERILEFFAASMTQVSGPMVNPLLNKFEPQHISDLIALGSRTLDANTSDRKHSRIFNFLSLALLVVASSALMLVLALINENDLLLEIVKLGSVALGGFGGGYGFSALRNRN